LLAIYKVKHDLKQKSFKEILYRKNHIKAWNDYYAMNSRSKELNYENYWNGPEPSYHAYVDPQYNTGPPMTAGAGYHQLEFNHYRPRPTWNTAEHRMYHQLDHRYAKEPRRDCSNPMITGIYLFSPGK
jgi:hypothetical protein